MRLLLLCIALVLPVTSGIAQDADGFVDTYIRRVLSRPYDHKMISSGRNFPPFDLRQEHRANLALLLHEGVPATAIGRYFGWTEAETERRLAELRTAGLVRRDSTGRDVPTLMVMTLGDVARHLPVSESLVEAAARVIAARLPEVRQRYEAAPGLRRVPFMAASLFVLSDVLLDNWQIQAVERGFLGAERPLRAGSRYYFSLQERAPWDSTEAFGVYGNQMSGYGPYTVGVYGNRRDRNPFNFLTLQADDLTRLFGTRPDTVRAFKQRLLAHLAAAAREPNYAWPPRYREGFEQLGWVRNGQVAVLVLDATDEAALDAMAAVVIGDLLALLEQYRPGLMQAYRASPYVAEVTFEEYFIWWYHLFYSAVTDRLIQQGRIVQPATGITPYLILPSS